MTYLGQHYYYYLLVGGLDFTFGSQILEGTAQSIAWIHFPTEKLWYCCSNEGCCYVQVNHRVLGMQHYYSKASVVVEPFRGHWYL